MTITNLIIESNAHIYIYISISRVLPGRTVLKDTDAQSPIAWSAVAHGIVIQDRPMLMGFIRDRGWTKDSRAFFDQLGKCGFKKQWVRNFGDAYVNPDVASVDAIAGMETMDTKKRKAKGTGPATAPKRTRADPS